MIISTRTSFNDSWLVSHPSWLFVSCVCVFFVFKITYEPARITVGSLAEELLQRMMSTWSDLLIQTSGGT